MLLHTCLLPFHTGTVPFLRSHGPHTLCVFSEILRPTLDLVPSGTWGSTPELSITHGSSLNLRTLTILVITPYLNRSVQVYSSLFSDLLEKSPLSVSFYSRHSCLCFSSLLLITVGIGRSTHGLITIPTF